MPKRPKKPLTPLAQSAVQIFAANDLMNQMLIEQLAPAAWQAPPPGKVRSIAAIFTHMHNVRTKWIRLTAPHLKIPAQLHRARCTQQQARKALAESAARCGDMLAQALNAPNDLAPVSEGSSVDRPGGLENTASRIHKFHRDAWAPAWAAGPEMLCYMLAHEAHHRGQVCMLAHQLGHTYPHSVADGIWNWEKLWKQINAARPNYNS
jgi:uncharacterized damage-inducible protein DinB